MPVTPQDIDRFHAFAKSRLSTSQPPDSLQECLDLWEQARELEETLDDMRSSQDELDRGMGVPLEEAEALIRQELGLPRSLKAGNTDSR